jgi:hypothetical protein
VSGGLDIKFFGRESRKRGVDEDRLAQSCHELAEPVLNVMMSNSRTLELGEHLGNPDDRAMAALSDALQVVALEHKHCGWVHPQGYERCPVPDISEMSTGEAYWHLLERWAVTTEVFMDTLCVHLQTRDLTDQSPLRIRPGGEAPDWVKEGWADNRKRRDLLIELLDKTLTPHGFHVTPYGEVVLAEHAGTQAEVEGPSLETLERAGWTDVANKMHEALREIAEGNPGDAVTDVATGLQAAFARAGYNGKTLGAQIKAARDKQAGGRVAFAGTHDKLGAAADNLSEWLAGLRNISSDAHHGPEATQTEAELAVRISIALSAWLADNSS